ncbi:MAG: aminopeptidase P family protein, partial [Geminicoccales bacterium]
MTTYASRIAATAERRKNLGSHGDLGPGALAVGEWQALGLEPPDLDALRAWRLARVRAGLMARDYA